MQVQTKRQPPYEVVGQAEHDRGNRPCSADDQHNEADWTEDLAGKANRGDQPSAFRTSCDFEIKDPVQADDHRKTTKDRRVIQRFETGKPKKPLRIPCRPDSPADVVQAGEDESNSVEFSATDHVDRHSGF